MDIEAVPKKVFWRRRVRWLARANLSRNLSPKFCNVPFVSINDCLREAITAVEPPSDRGRRLKIFYATQANCAPPTFVLFVNGAKLMHFSYLRYLENYFRKTFDFSGTPIRFIVRERNENK